MLHVLSSPLLEQFLGKYHSQHVKYRIRNPPLPLKKYHFSSGTNSKDLNETKSEIDESTTHSTIQFDSGSSSDEYDRSDADDEDANKIKGAKSSETVSIDSEETDTHQSTMWLGTEDGCIHVYNSCDNIRIKKNKIKIQHCSSVLCIM